MKKYPLFVAFLAVASVTCSSCFKSEGPKTTVTYNSPFTMQATVDGNIVDFPTVSTIQSGTNFIIEGVSGTPHVATYPYLMIYINNWNRLPGTFTFDSLGFTTYAQYYVNSSNVAMSKTGSVEITSVTATFIAGVFSFKCDNGTVISKGSFKARPM